MLALKIEQSFLCHWDCRNIYATQYVAVKKIVQMYYLSMSHKSLKMICDYKYTWIVFLTAI